MRLENLGSAISPGEAYALLMEEFGPQGWWPSKSKRGEAKAFEIAVGAILTQQVAWRNVELAVENLRKKGLLDAIKLAKASKAEVEGLVRSTGFYRQKAKRIMSFAEWLSSKYRGSITRLLAKPVAEARRELLSFNGIGRETADSILLYAGNKGIFVVDAYTRRLCDRLGMLENASGMDYDDVRRFFEEKLPENARAYNEMHALVVELCKRNCRTKPLCSTCVLKQRCAYANANKQK
jgi:endonuclease-3 related protein